MSIISLRNVRKIYHLDTTEVVALNDISFDIEKSDFVSLIGPSGSGKSTVLNILGCIDTATAGEVIIDGQDISGFADRDLTRLRQRFIGFIFQSFNLLPVLNVVENVEFPLLITDKKRSPEQKRKDAEYIDYLIEAVGLTEWRNHKPNELSGGQRQRVAIARALVTRPSVVMADEPTANLDSTNGENIIALMKQINREFQTTFIFSTHDQNIYKDADHVIRLKDGSVAENFRRQKKS
ncbi:MAG: ABC transporter ATP-binding protein [Spirochaetaceae bacterium]|nr:ABC transporter ATP-binding protein [Spirochaetaceae bacterium]